MEKGASTQLSVDSITANLKTRLIGREVLLFKSTSSTNDIAAEYAKNKNNNGLVIFTEQQTAGRGRGANKWFSKAGESLLCSILLTKGKLNPELLSLTAAVAVAEAIGKVGDDYAQIKWPNDIILNGQKAAGILLESKPINSNTAYIIGIGINCHQEKISFPKLFRSAATSIDIESRTKCDRLSLAKRLLTSLDHWLIVSQKNTKKVIGQWQKLSIQLGHRVTLVYNSKNFAGNCIGIDPQKGLIVQLDHGGVRMFDAAHTSNAK